MQQIDYIFTRFSARSHTRFSPVTNPKLDTFEYLDQSVTFLISIIIQNLTLNLMKVSYSVMAETLRLTVSTTNFTRKVEETVDVKFDESNGSQVEQLPIDVGDKDPSEAIQDLSIGKVHPTEVKESTSSVQVEASTSRQGEPRVDTEASTSGTHQDKENEEVHQDEDQQPPSPPRQENDNVNNEEGQEEEDHGDSKEYL